jgi:hypothetical protein
MDIPALLKFFNMFGVGKSVASRDEDDPIGEIASVLVGMKTSNSNSIKYRAKNLIAQYPILYSDNVSSSTVQLLNKALEVEYVNLLRLIIQNNGASNNFSSTDKYLQGFHQNIHNDRNLDDTLQSIAGDNSARNESAMMEVALKQANKELLTPIDEDLNMRTVNEDTVLKGHRALLEADSDKDKDKDEDKKGDTFQKASANVDKIEIQKANELTPTSVTATITYIPTGSSQPVPKDITFGVKCVAHLLQSVDIEKYLPNTVITRSPMMRAIQWTTGEIKFVKDFLLNIDEIKDMAVDNNDRGNFWWRKLSELSRVSKLNPFLRKLSGNKLKGNNPIPTATMVITKENVDNIRHRHGIDILNKPTFAYKIMKNFFLMTFIVVDESIETMYMYNEDTKNFSAYSFKSLEGFSKQKKMDIKDLYELIR